MHLEMLVVKQLLFSILLSEVYYICLTTTYLDERCSTVIEVEIKLEAVESRLGSSLKSLTVGRSRLSGRGSCSWIRWMAWLRIIHNGSVTFTPFFLDLLFMRSHYVFSYRILNV